MKDQKGQPRFQVSDRRFWVRDEKALEQAEIPGRRYPSFVEELKGRTELAEQRLREKIEELEKENQAYRLRLRRQIEGQAVVEKIEFLRGLLEVVDNFERALEASQSALDAKALQEGVRLSLKLLIDKLKSAGVEPLEVVGRPFDPNCAEAVTMVPSDDPAQDQTVLEELQRGYCFEERLLRPAKVRVGVYQPSES